MLIESIFARGPFAVVPPCAEVPLRCGPPLRCAPPPPLALWPSPCRKDFENNIGRKILSSAGGTFTLRGDIALVDLKSV